MLLPGDEFEMGSPEDEPNRRADREGPVHTVTVGSFLIAKREVMKAEYAAVMAGHASLSPNPSHFTGDVQRPVEQVSWNDLHAADGFLARTGLELPTEARWEYACRGGTSTAFSWGDECNVDDCSPCTPAVDFMWYCNAGEVTHPVGEKRADPFGLHDMHGNVWELCEDWYQADYYQELVDGGQPVIDPLCENPRSGRRVGRGGGWNGDAGVCRSGFRTWIFPGFRGISLGFRPSMPLP